MNANLRATMTERAKRGEDGPIDLASVIRTGDRRRRIRGTAMVGAVAAACAVAVFGVVQVSGSTGDTGSPEYAANHRKGDFRERVETYAVGSRIHYGQKRIDVGDHTIESFVQTDDGFVFAESDGSVYLANGSSVREIGSGDADGHYLKADDSGSYVAWVDSESGDAPEFVVYDTAAMEEVVRTSEGNESGAGTLPDEGGAAYVFAVDGDGTYVLNGEGFARIDLGSGDTELLRDDVSDGFAIPDVANGWILRDVEPPDDGNEESVPGVIPPGGTVLSRDPDADQPRTVESASGLSPDGRYVVSDYSLGKYNADSIVDTSTGDRIRTDAPDHSTNVESQWIDADTVVMVAYEGAWKDPHVSLWTCELPAGNCSSSTIEVPYKGLQLPDGEHADRK